MVDIGPLSIRLLIIAPDVGTFGLENEERRRKMGGDYMLELILIRTSKLPSLSSSIARHERCNFGRRDIDCEILPFVVLFR